MTAPSVQDTWRIEKELAIFMAHGTVRTLPPGRTNLARGVVEGLVIMLVICFLRPGGEVICPSLAIGS